MQYVLSLAEMENWGQNRHTKLINFAEGSGNNGTQHIQSCKTEKTCFHQIPIVNNKPFGFNDSLWWTMLRRILLTLKKLYKPYLFVRNNLAKCTHNYIFIDIIVITSQETVS